VISLRYSNVFGSLRQNPENVIMSMRESARKDGYVWVTGDGEQSRDFTSVHDICRANLLAARGDYTGSLDICTGHNQTMNKVAAAFGCRIQYRPERAGDVKHIVQDPVPAWAAIGFQYEVPFEEGMKAYLEGQ
jgi:UDP-glucose 4-epimerase